MEFKQLTALVLLALMSPLTVNAIELIDENAGGSSVLSGGNVDQAMSRARMNLKEIQSAWSKSDPMANVTVVQYAKNVTHKLRLREMMNTLIVLPEGEVVKGVSLGDKANFVYEPVSNDEGVVFENMGNVRAVYPGADTNLILITESGHIYSFYLRVDTVESKYMPNLVVYVESDKIERENKQRKEAAENKKKQAEEEKVALEKKLAETEKEAEYLRNREISTPSDLTFSYKQISGDAALMPIRIYDDGIWTWFQFDENNLDKVKNLPAIYRVVDGVDTPVNSRTEGGAVIVETVSDKWTLRSGGAHACIRKAEK